MKQMKLPPPGSPEAVALGCRCARMDNHHGKGYMGIEGVYVYSGACKLHAQEMQQKKQELDAINEQIEAKKTETKP